MPFDDEDNEQPSLQSKKVGLKNVSSQKSMFDTMPKKPSQEDLDTKVKQIQDRSSAYKGKAADLASQFNRSMADKTLPQNKNLFQKDAEKEILSQMVQLAIDINNDPSEKEGMGSLSWIVLLLKTCFSQRDKINQLEYQQTILNGKIDQTHLTALISKEIAKALDSFKKGE